MGRILRPRGVQGEMRVESLSDAPNRFHARARLFVRGAPYVIRRSRVHKGALLLTLEGIDTREAAEALRGAELEVPESEVPTLPQDVYYHFQVMGLAVVTTTGEELGKVTRIFNTGGSDVYAVQGPRGELLIPAIGDVVKEVDLAGGRLIVEPIPGLL